MSATATTPLADDLKNARRDEAAAAAKVVGGVAVSIAGIAMLLAMFIVFLTLWTNPTNQQIFGTLLLATVAFAVSAWGTDVGRAAHKQRKALRARTNVLKSAREYAGEA